MHELEPLIAQDGSGETAALGSKETAREKKRIRV